MTDADAFEKMMKKRWRWENQIKPQITLCISIVEKMLMVGVVLDGLFMLIELWTI